ncbi:uncharacterized protein [Chironomus tepperi]|uniref:uncharacterized protein n=1 Tax=Chironomus tepperi TaxID=113505 RepID=UPI00391F719D
MKLVIGLLIFALALGAYSQEETIMSVQAELGLTHRFFEIVIGINRGQLSAYNYRITRSALHAYMDTYRFIYDIGAEAREHMNSLVPENESQQVCLNIWMRRFELQKLRFGQRLARCTAIVNDHMHIFNDIVNDIHSKAQWQAAQVQNIGFNVLAEAEVYDGDEDFAALMKTDLREDIFRILDLVEEATDFIVNISNNIIDIQNEFTQCYRQLEEDAVREIQIEVDGANSCVWTV